MLSFLSLRGALNLVSYPTVLSTYISTFSLLETVLRECTIFLFFHRSCCSGRWLFLNYDLFVKRARKVDVRQFMKRKNICDSRSVEKISDKRLRIEVQSAQTKVVERV